MIDYELIFFLSACGYVWAEILTREGMILGWVPRLYKSVGFPEWALKPLYACAVCVTGFWSLLFLSASLYRGHMEPVAALFTLVAAILITKILTRYA